MPFVLEPSASVGTELPRVVRHRLRQAVRMLDQMDHDRPSDVNQVVHEVRKRCKEVRAAARLVRTSLGPEYREFNSSVRDAAALLAPIRDAYATQGTFEQLGVSPDLLSDDNSPDPAHAGADPLDERVAAARRLLKASRRKAKHWELADDFGTLRLGLRAAYRRGQKRLRRVERRPTDKAAHEWRKSVKELWYQVRLVERAAPSALGPYRVQLDELAETLGGDHDLALLIAALDAAPERYGGSDRAEEVRRVALAEQTALRRRAIRLGATLYAERADAFVTRVKSYWECTRQHGSEPAISDADDHTDPVPATEDVVDARPALERERKYLLAHLPAFPVTGTEIRQGYLAIDGTVSVRVRLAGNGPHTLTIKCGHGAVRTELEWQISEAEFETAWSHTERRRIAKTRYRVPIGAHVAEVDVFHGALDGLVLAEVEFDSYEALAEFSPPRWFGTDVTDDEMFTNASLATNALPGPLR